MPLVLINQDTMTAIGAAIREKLGEDILYLPSEMPDKILSISGGSATVTFDWGSETSMGNETWWTDLQTFVQNSTAAQRQELVGKKKNLQFTNTILGMSFNQFKCIAADHDGEKTLTFCAVYPFTNPVARTNLNYSYSDINDYCGRVVNYSAIYGHTKAVSKKYPSSASGLSTGNFSAFVPSGKEVFGSTYQGTSGYYLDDGTQYDYFKTAANRVFRDMSSGTYRNWHTRSTMPGVSTLCTLVDSTNNKCIDSSLSATQYFVPMFVIG